ncbi:AGE family epimerase/isomerase [Pseudoruegeria sp. SK021]|uniref:AGE family epimerase/isomerase n=1 Tax=Pseudoruegeria sp. SK021 TaxID=1933035 RepID=UPI000A2158C8|nr:AGE family epimerase/isomerase [Pseudoruegeria sp. SK021]OSP55593.1 hypothetical protein BV911_06930 [Pseudoruegeria sp. SK021]
MTQTPLNSGDAIAAHPQNNPTSAQDWVDWYWATFLPGWIDRAQDSDGLGFFDLLDAQAQPLQPDRRTLLAQARLLFTFSHLALVSGNLAYRDAAQIARNALPAFRKAPGLYCRATTRTGQATGNSDDALATSYDQSFVVLGLATWGKLNPDEDVEPELEACWSAVETLLTDPVTGLMLEHDGVGDPAADEAPNRAQNPHMHLYEAALQAYEMTGKPVWMDRAAAKRAKGLEYFLDPETGTITEFLAPALTILPGRDGQRREIGHQCEWAWLLIREADLGGDPAMRQVAARMLAFADQHGFAKTGVMQGAAFDAVSADVSWREDRFLLWPQTEAIKAHAVRAGQGDYADKAQALALVMFQQYFAGRAGFINQVDASGQAVWPEGLSRLHYHIVLGLTEGARAGLWRYPA